MEWTDLALHPKAMDWIEEFLDQTDKKITVFSVGYFDPKRINMLAEKYPEIVKELKQLAEDWRSGIETRWEIDFGSKDYEYVAHGMV